MTLLDGVVGSWGQPLTFIHVFLSLSLISWVRALFNMMHLMFIHVNVDEFGRDGPCGSGSGFYKSNNNGDGQT